MQNKSYAEYKSLYPGFKCECQSYKYSVEVYSGLYFLTASRETNNKPLKAPVSTQGRKWLS